jgi:Ribonuclease P
MNCLEDRRGKNHRMAVSISRKHDKRAVQRNRYRRGLYDGMRDILASTKYIERSSLPLDMPVGISPVQSTKIDTPIPTLPQTRNFLCVFTLKKGLKIPEKKIPETWIDDAKKLLSGVV